MDPMNYTPPTQPVPAPAPAYATSCLKAAWEDVKATPNYVSRLLVLGLIMCVPILNFVVAGYLLFWAREVPFGGRSLLPEKIVTGKNFEYGFYAFVLSLVVGLVGGIVGGIFGWIPFIGWVVSVTASSWPQLRRPFSQMSFTLKPSPRLIPMIMRICMTVAAT